MDPFHPVGLHYQLSCYVGSSGTCVASAPGEYLSFTTIFTRRPDGCRYAVGRIVPFELCQNRDTGTPVYRYGTPLGPFLAWDLYRATTTSLSSIVRAPPASWAAETEEALVMKVLALYDAED